MSFLQASLQIKRNPVFEGAEMYLYIKRFLDLILSLCAIIVLLPVILILSVIIKIDDPSGPVFFRQKRFGKDKEFFYIYKFRTMKQDAPHDVPTEDVVDPLKYVTRSGKWIRRYSLDELPQFFNVFIGDMSIVAPRPALWNQDNLIRERDQYTGKYGLTPNNYRPGITGWAQINGRDALNDAAKAAMDGEYVRRISFLFDCRCFFGTFLKVFRHEGVKE